MNDLYIILGVSMTGKSTLANSFNDCYIIRSDNYTGKKSKFKTFDDAHKFVCQLINDLNADVVWDRSASMFNKIFKELEQIKNKRIHLICIELEDQVYLNYRKTTHRKVKKDFSLKKYHDRLNELRATMRKLKENGIEYTIFNGGDYINVDGRVVNVRLNLTALGNFLE